MFKGNCVIAQSGGPTAVINSSLAGAIEAALGSAAINEVYGARHGILGILQQNLWDLRREDPASIQGLRHTPGAALGSCRYQLKKQEDYEKLLDIFRRYNVRYFFYIGGNDSMDTAAKVNRLAVEEGYDLRVIGIPKTVDNDLPLTDHCPGYGSAAKFLAASVLEMGIDIQSIVTSTKVAIVETMGRNTGWLAAATALARRQPGDAPHLIYLPEVAFDMATFLTDVEEAYRQHDTVLVVVSEGLLDKDGNYIFNDAATQDVFGHQRLGGLGQFLLNKIEGELKIKGRVILPATSQRSAMHLASRTDAEEAYAVGRAAVEAAVQGASGKMVALNRQDGEAYCCTCELVDLDQVANREKKVPRTWINAQGNDITAAFINYARPLIQGEVNIPYRDGLPAYVNLSGHPVPKPE
ncbi:6-phosphofructokinase [Moorella sp. Hama-1]|uniref:6-phosphofructokinase n=1 Tax=Moorella sp. Hama-1 TaxID=2138101 RepID=UPI000D65EF50|nr:6-phosphofructokinase [Moorella sp. Hama-1]MDN5361890.1 ATP-dependent phosphofructokinase / diphosphate-dependent phosphofructokinase [Moorella sp. (in: firmicutes)]BCV21363.1 pyrophosphate--fructose 6-phosphate 1-phosphotransferase [Moorella sp. Hama-1]